MIYRHSYAQVQEYYGRPELNQSSLKTLIGSGGIQKYLHERERLTGMEDLYYEEKDFLIIGSGVDCKITHGEDVYKEQYYFSDTDKPGDKVMSILQLAFDVLKRNNPEEAVVNDLNIYKELIHGCCNNELYFMNRAKSDYMADTRIATVIKEGSAYWQLLVESNGKQILGADQVSIIDAVTHNILNHKFTSHLFKDDRDTDIVFQLPMFWEYQSVACKGMIDMVMINHKRKKIFPLDIKTMSDYVTKFNIAVKKRRYDIQASFYDMGLKKNIKELGAIINRKLDDYEVANFAFIAESTTKPGTPLVFPVTDALMEQGANGDNADVEGWLQGLRTYKKWAALDFNLEAGLEKMNGVCFIDRDYEYAIKF